VCIALHVKHPLFLSDLLTVEFLRQIFAKSSDIKFHENPSSGSRVVPDGRTDMTKLMVAFRSFVNAPKDCIEKPRVLGMSRDAW
jgi:hypothetical protein